MIEIGIIEKPKHNIIYNGKVHKFNEHFQVTECSHAKLEEHDFVYTSKEVNCRSCIKISNIYDKSARRIADIVDNDILNSISND